jgi:predicted MPP superfamily phosphohydrolase
LYLCDNKFHTQALTALLNDDQRFGFVVMDGNGSLYGTVCGNTREILHKFTVDLPKKHGRGGQSALRFARLRVEKRHNYIGKVAETATSIFITDDMPNIAGLVLAGSAEFKQQLTSTERLDPRLVGLRIVQISDIHVGPTIKRARIARMVSEIDALDADIVAITGDLVDGSVASLREHTAPIADLRARHGVFFVTGNHEYYAGAEEWIAELRRLGLTVLLNEHRVLERGGAPFVVAGVTDYSAGRMVPAHASDPHRAAAGAPTGVFKLLLAHQPRSAFAAAEAGFDLQLSGHTHGGQFVPWNLFVPLQQPFTHSLSTMGRLQVYTSRGTGYWGPPVRLGASSEITRLTLAAA